MSSQPWMLALCMALASVLGTGDSVSTTETHKYACKTYGSGVVRPFNGSSFYVRSNCPFTFTRFTHNRVEYDITIHRGDNGLLVKVEIIINKIRTVLQDGGISVEKKSVSLPYDHTYQHIFHYGIYTQLRSSLLPLSVTWHNVPGGIDAVWVELEQDLNSDMMGLCGKFNSTGNQQQLITSSTLGDDTCQIRDPVFAVNQVCRMFFSYTLECLLAMTPQYIQLCEENIYTYEMSNYIGCAFYKEVVQQCGNSSYVWNAWRSLTKCEKPNCPGDLVYVELGPAFIPSCSNPNPRFSNQDLTSSCICPMGMVLNDREDGFHCVSVTSCPCVFAGKNYSSGDVRSTKCQSCMCDSGKWHCSENLCPARCLIEDQFVTTFDGKKYSVPGKCAYVASQGLNWTIVIEFSKKAPSLKAVVLHLYQEKYTFSQNMVKIGQEEITELHQSAHALVFWQSSMYVQVHTSVGLKIQVQMSPEIQLYITPPANHTGIMSGLCGNSNNDTTDDLTTSSGIAESSAQLFARSWSLDTCPVNIHTTCVNTDNEIFADEKCSVLNNPTGIFAKCHDHIPTDHYHTACIQRTCNCGRSLQQCLCVALGSYVKACASLGVVMGDWREATNCTLTCQKNQEFSYNMQACNHTCRSLSGPDPRCGLDDDPVEGCGCPEGTHLNQGNICTPKTECPCHYYGGTAAPGSVVIDGRQCICESGQLQCSEDCGCRNGKVCVHCSEYPVNTAQKTCGSISKPVGAGVTCESGCYCPHHQYEDHHGNCVALDNCTCVHSGKVFNAGQSVKTNCKACVCGQGQWHCKDEPCSGKCQVYGNGHYQTFDSTWYRFDGHCQYTLVEDDCGYGNGSFSVRVESVPCCDEALTCSRSITLDLQGTVTLTLIDMKVTRRHHVGWTLREDSLYSVNTVGLYIIITVPSRGITLIWDKHTRLTIDLHSRWKNRVCGLCGNFDANEMNDLQITGSAVLSGPLVFGNSWKTATPPCSDVTTEIFPCERNSYCSAWAQRRCMIITGDTFKGCHLKVDPEPYYHACVQESCSCEFEGKFLGFCTAVAAYAEACSDQDVCINWRTPDLCPVYCDYYNEQGQCSWHYEACGEMLTCGKDNYFTHKLEGCYPRCPKESPYYDENRGECTNLKNCSCYFNETIIQPGAVVLIETTQCYCDSGKIVCSAPPTTTSSSPTTASATTETTELSTTSTPTTTTSFTTETTELSSTSTPTTTTSFTTETTELSTTSTPTTTISFTTETTELSSTSTPTTTTLFTTETTELSTTSTPTTTTLFTTETTELSSTSTSTTTTSFTTETTELSTTSTPTTTTSFTTETTELSTTSTPTTTASATTETTELSTTSTPTTTTSFTTETTGLSTTSTPTTTTSFTTETTGLSTTSTPTTTTSFTTETTELSSTSTSTTTTSFATETTELSSTSTPTTTTSFTTETTELSTTSTPTTTTSFTTEATELSTTSTPTTTTSFTTETTELSSTSTQTTSFTTETTELSSTSTPTTSFTTETTELSSTSTPTTTTSFTTETTELSSTSTPTTTTSFTTETTELSTTSTPTTTTSFTTETTELSSASTPTTTTSLTTETTELSSTSTPTTATSFTTETTELSTTSTPTTSFTTETTELSSTSTPTTTIITTTETTELSSTSTPTTTTLLTTETTELSSTSTPTTSFTTETTELSSTSTPTTTIITTTETTELSSTSTPTTTTLLTTETTELSSTSTPTTATSFTTETTELSSTSTPTTTSSFTTETTERSTTSTPSTATSFTTETTELSTTSTPTTTTSFTTETTELSSTSTPTTTITTTTETTELSSTSTPTTTTSFTTETTELSNTSTPTTTTSFATQTTELSTTSTPTTTTSFTTETTEFSSASTPTTTTSFTTQTTELSTEPPSSTTFTPHSTTQDWCECKDLKRNKTWSCNETWTEDCYSKTCVDKKIQLTSEICPEPKIPICPRQQATKVSDGCCETWKCDCRCDIYGDPHYISFQGVNFDFLDDCTYILMEEPSPRHHLTIAVDNEYCVPGLEGSCAKGVIVNYQNSTATLTIIPNLFAVQATLNNVTIEPPYEEHGWRFETTGYIVYIYLPEIRSYVSLSPSWTLVISLAMEHFFNNTQGQCGVCGIGSCIRKGGQIEDDSCCDKTAYDWVYADPQKPACDGRPKDVPCLSTIPTVTPPTSTSTTSCPKSQLCELLLHPVFANCSMYVDLNPIRKNCEFDSCRSGPCSSLEQAAQECKKAGFCIDWRRLTNGSCDVSCPEGLVYSECRVKLDDFCYGGVRYPGAAIETSTGCFCPSGQFRATNHSDLCVSQCPCCKGPLGEPRWLGEVWRSGCNLCTCNKQTQKEDCFPRPPELPPTCSPNAVLVNTSCCGDQICVEKTCSYNGTTYKVGDRWKDALHPCKSFSCSKDGVQTETTVCPTDNCPEENRRWDSQHCCFTCDYSCSPKLTSINVTIDNCTTIMQVPVCRGQCVYEPRMLLDTDLQVEQECQCCREQSSERRSVTLQCADLTSRRYNYKHITSCGCRGCVILR